jgi:hypothetical protein
LSIIPFSVAVPNPITIRNFFIDVWQVSERERELR